MFRYFIGVVDYKDYFGQPDVEEGGFKSEKEANAAMEKRKKELSSNPRLIIVESQVISE